VSFGDRRQIDLDVFVVVVVDVSGLHRRRFVEVVRRRGAAVIGCGSRERRADRGTGRIALIRPGRRVTVVAGPLDRCRSVITRLTPMTFTVTLTSKIMTLDGLALSTKQLSTGADVDRNQKEKNHRGDDNDGHQLGPGQRCTHTVRDNYNLKSHKYVRITTYQPDTKSNPNPNPNHNPTTKQHAIVNIQLNIDACPTRHVVAPSVRLSAGIVTMTHNVMSHYNVAILICSYIRNHRYRC